MSRKAKALLAFVSLILFQCATDPGTNSPTAGGAITFTYETGDAKVFVNTVQGSRETTNVVGAVVLLDRNSEGKLRRATQIASGVGVAFPSSLTITLPIGLLVAVAVTAMQVPRTALG